MNTENTELTDLRRLLSFAKKTSVSFVTSVFVKNKGKRIYLIYLKNLLNIIY